MKTLIQRTGVLVIGIVLLSAAIPSTQATEEQNPKSVYENAASEYRIAVMQIWTPRKTSPLSPVSDSLTESVPGEWNEGSTWIFRS